jgi:hypothetical protein
MMMMMMAMAGRPKIETPAVSRFQFSDVIDRLHQRYFLLCTHKTP